MKTGLKIALGIGGVIGGYYLLKNLGSQQDDTDTLEDANENLQNDLGEAQSQIDALQALINEFINDPDTDLDSALALQLSDLNTTLGTLQTDLEGTQQSFDNLYSDVYSELYTTESQEIDSPRS